MDVTLDKLLEKVYQLMNRGYINTKTIKLIECECGRVEIPVDNLKSINMSNSLMYRINDKYYCS